MKKIISVLLLLSLLSIAATEGPRSGATFANDVSNGGDYSWTNTSQAATSNDSSASVTATVPSSSRYLKVTNFGFSTVSGTINGIFVTIEGKGTSSGVIDEEITIVKNGSPAGNPHGDAGTYWNVTDTYMDHGGPTDLWGVSWTPSDITSSNFGVAISVYLSSSATAWIDHVAIAVYYTTASGMKRRVFGKANGIPVDEPVL